MGQKEKTVLPTTKHSHVPIFSLLSPSHTLPPRLLTVKNLRMLKGEGHSFRGTSPNRRHAVWKVSFNVITSNVKMKKYLLLL